MTPKKNVPPTTSLPEDERATLPDINAEPDEADTLPRPRKTTPGEDIGSVQRPPADS
jgi:hypothetical protein